MSQRRIEWTFAAAMLIGGGLLFSQDYSADQPSGPVRLASDESDSRPQRSVLTNRSRSTVADRIQNARAVSDERPRELSEDDAASDESSGSVSSRPRGGANSGRRSVDSISDREVPSRNNFDSRSGSGGTSGIKKSPVTNNKSVRGNTWEAKSKASSGPAGPRRSAPVADLQPPQQNVAERPSKSVDDADRIVVSSKGPAIHVETVGPRAIKIGREAVYQVDLVNNGDEAAGEVLVRIVVPEWIQVVGAEGGLGEAKAQANETGGTRVVWAVEQVPAHATQQLSLRLVPQQNRPFDLIVDWTFRPSSAAAQIEVQQPQLEITLEGPKDILFGETAVYTVAISNPGTGDAEDVVISLNPGDGDADSKQVGIIAAGERQELKVELSARKSGSITVSAKASAAGGLVAETSEQILVRRAELKIEVEGPEARFAGGTASYRLRVSNHGNAPAGDAELSVTLPPGAKLVAGIDGSRNQSLATAWQLPNIPPGSEKVFEISCSLATPGENSLRAKVKSAGGEAIAACVTHVETLADLKLVVNDPQGPKTVGEEAIYEIMISNRGSKAAEGVEVVAHFSSGIEPTQAIGAQAEIVTGQVIFKPIPRLEPGQQLAFKVVARASQPGHHRFRAEVASDNRETLLVAEDTTRFYGEELIRSATRTKGSAKR